MTVLFHPEVNRRWSRADCEFVVDMTAAGVSPSAIAAVLEGSGREGTSAVAVAAKIVRLRKCGLLDRQPRQPRQSSGPAVEPDPAEPMHLWPDAPGYFEDDPRAVESAR
jgi:hypothetical protein